jgi:hypothetical protein
MTGGRINAFNITKQVIPISESSKCSIGLVCWTPLIFHP